MYAHDELSQLKNPIREKAERNLASFSNPILIASTAVHADSWVYLTLIFFNARFHGRPFIQQAGMKFVHDLSIGLFSLRPKKKKRTDTISFKREILYIINFPFDMQKKNDPILLRFAIPWQKGEAEDAR